MKPTANQPPCEDDRRPSSRLIAVAIALFVGGFVLLFGPTSRWVKSTGALTVGVSQTILLVDTYRRREIRTNWVTVRRSDRPRWFQIEFLFWTAFAAIFTLLLLLYALRVNAEVSVG